MEQRHERLYRTIVSLAYIPRVCTERCTLHRYNWRDSVDSRHNPKVRDFLFSNPHTSPYTQPPSVAKNQIRLAHHKNRLSSCPLVASTRSSQTQSSTSPAKRSATPRPAWLQQCSSTTAATLRGGVPGSTIASLLLACEDVPPNHRSPLPSWARSCSKVIIAGVFPWCMGVIFSLAAFFGKVGMRGDIGSRIYED